MECSPYLQINDASCKYFEGFSKESFDLSDYPFSLTSLEAASSANPAEKEDDYYIFC